MLGASRESTPFWCEFHTFVLTALDGFPPVEDCDLVSYLVLQTSFITLAQLKARKGLEAYNQFVYGWIKEVSTRKIAGRYLTTGRVSQVIKRVYTYFIALKLFHAGSPFATIK